MHNQYSRRAVARVVATKLLTEPERRKHWLRATAAYLIEHTMAEDVDLLLNDIARELYEQAGQLMVDVVSARPLSSTIREQLKHALRETTNAKHVELSERIDPDLLGGLVARTPDATLDTSVRSQLKALAAIK